MGTPAPLAPKFFFLATMVHVEDSSYYKPGARMVNRPPENGLNHQRRMLGVPDALVMRIRSSFAIGVNVLAVNRALGRLAVRAKKREGYHRAYRRNGAFPRRPAIQRQSERVSDSRDEDAPSLASDSCGSHFGAL